MKLTFLCLFLSLRLLACFFLGACVIGGPGWHCWLGLGRSFLHGWMESGYRSLLYFTTVTLLFGAVQDFDKDVELAFRSDSELKEDLRWVVRMMTE
jgi:hypothetical protein